MRNHWIDERAMEDRELRTPRGRNPDSSLDPQYEDYLPPEQDEVDEPS